MSKWVYCIKHDHNRMITKHKVRLMVKGCSQIPRIDFMETFTPVMRLETFWLLIALTTKLKLVIHVVDVVGAYLNGTLDEVIFMMQPLEYDDGTGRVWQLLQPLYGLKQVGRAWNKELNQTFLKIMVPDWGQAYFLADLVCLRYKSGMLLGSWHPSFSFSL
jgi:Reverse transcriptase (RNA-dependent DNA polymerase)